MKLEDRLEYLKRSRIKKKRKRSWYTKWWGFLIAILLYFVAIFVVGFALVILRVVFDSDFREAYIAHNRNNFQNIQQSIELKEFLSRRLSIVEGPSSPYLGGSDAQIRITSFSDFNCPFSKKASEVITALSVKYGQKIKITSRELPILSEDSMSLALAALCAKDQGRYWPMYYKLFNLQGQFSVNDLASIARQAGVPDVIAFSNCLNSEKNYKIIIQSVVDAEFLGVSGTPAWFINGEKIHEGTIDLDTFSEILDRIIAKHNL